jgi:secondary thiamine-phosphate synthase enzyme
VATRLSAIITQPVETVHTGVLSVRTPGEGFTLLTRDAAQFLTQSGAVDGMLFLFLRHTSASLVIQENADPDVLVDLKTALRHIAPEGGVGGRPWVHDTEGPDDMPAHIKTMVAGHALHIPVAGGAMRLGTWQGIYLVEHRAAAHQREVVLQFIGR